MIKKPFCYIFIGFPGVGKGTFAKIISRQTDVEHIAIGDLVRHEITHKSPSGLKFQNYVAQGKLIPDDLIDRIAIDRVSSTSKSVILDGYPRNQSQASNLETSLNNSHHILAINITLDEQVTIDKLLGRMLCKTCKDEFNSTHILRNGYDMPAILPDPATCKLGPENCKFIADKRVDDNIETIKKRMEEFEKQTKPLIRFYESKNALVTFDVKKGARDAPDLLNVITDYSAKLSN